MLLRMLGNAPLRVKPHYFSLVYTQDMKRMLLKLIILAVQLVCCMHRFTLTLSGWVHLHIYCHSSNGNGNSVEWNGGMEPDGMKVGLLECHAHNN